MSIIAGGCKMSNSRKNSGVRKFFFEKSDFDEIKNCKSLALRERLSVLADMIRLNTLTEITHARSGHIGASFSAIEILTVLYHHAMNVDPSRPKRKGRDIFILSKGHAAAALYAVLASRGFIPTDKLATFRRLGGLEGHAELSVPGVETNTGSLGIGISKAKGFAWAYKSDRVKASAFILVGDGELQEGQNWEAIQSAAFWKSGHLYLIIDRNYVQTDMEVSKILDVSPIEAKLKIFGWYPVTVDGHNTGEILDTINRLKKITGKPKAIIANTIKGKGVSFMEHPRAIAEGRGIYKWHDKIPNEEEYALAWNEIISRIKGKIEKYKIQLEFPALVKHPLQESPFKGESLLKAFSDYLVELGEKHENLVVFDADLAESCGLRKFQEAFPDRFIEVGIAEQDMVSTAGGFALAGKLPIVNTYTAFLTSRANEQIFNNVSEGSKIIYVGHLAGILPAKPGKSHQGIRDISLLKAIPNMIMCQPCNALELRKLLKFLFFETSQSSYLRLEHFAPRRDVRLPKDYKVRLGKGAVLARGNDAAIIGYGPLLLSEALLAREELKKEGIEVKVINMPWLNNIDERWLVDSIGDAKTIICLENHAVVGGQSEEVMRIMSSREGGTFKFYTLGIEGFGLSGDGAEILSHYGIDWLNIAKKIKKWLKK